MKDNDVLIIKMLLEHKNEDLNISSISEHLQKDYKTIHTIVKRLERLRIIRIKEFGKSLKVELMNILHPSVFLAEHERRTDVLKNKDLAVMLDSFLNGIETKCFVLLLFGSYAKKITTKHSDIDLMFIVPNKLEDEMEKKIYGIASL